MLDWIAADHATLQGVPVVQVTRDYHAHRTTSDRIVVLKDRTYFDDYAQLAADPRNILEIGIFEGGSALILAEMFPAARIAGLDIKPRLPAVEAHIERMGFSDRLSLHHEISQADEAAVLGVLDALGGPPDLVIDDASHDYGLTRRSLEIILPRMKPGAAYVIEDWAWAHWPGDGCPARRGPTLSNLIFELTMACASCRPLVEAVAVNSRYAVVTRGRGEFAGTIDLDARLTFGPRQWSRLA